MHVKVKLKLTTTTATTDQAGRVLFLVLFVFPCFSFLWPLSPQVMVMVGVWFCLFLSDEHREWERERVRPTSPLERFIICLQKQLTAKGSVEGMPYERENFKF